MDYQANFLQSLAGGFDFGQKVKAQQDSNALRQLASQSYGVQPEDRRNHLAKLAGLSPDFATQTQKRWNAEDANDRDEIIRMARLIKNAPQGAQKQLYDRLVPALRLRGMPAPDWDDQTEKTILGTVAALTQWDDKPSEVPSGYQEFDLLTKAAGYQPGSDEYKKAAGVRLGTYARPPAGGFSRDTIDIGDGKQRAARFNPRTGIQEYYDEGKGQWLQLGGPGELDGAGGYGNPPAPGPATSPNGFNAGSGNNASRVNIEGIAPEEQQFYANSIATMRQAGFSNEETMGWLEQQLRQRAASQEAGQIPPSPEAAGSGNVPGFGNPSARSTGGPRYAPPGVGAGRSKEEEAAAVKTAEINAELDAAPAVNAAEADAAAAKAAAEAEVKRLDGARTTLSQVEGTANDMLGLIRRAKTHPGRAAATGLSGRLDPRNYVDGSNARDFQVLLDQMGGKAFLEAFNSLRGGGQITETEGRKATEAIGRLSRAQSDNEFLKALTDLEEVVTLGIERARKSAQPRSPAGNGWSITRRQN